MKRTLPIAEAKARFAECVRRAEVGETIVLTRHGRPVARLAPVAARIDVLAGEFREPESPYRATGPAAPLSQTPRRRREELERLLEESIWPRVPKNQLGVKLGKREREEILGYGDDGF